MSDEKRTKKEILAELEGLKNELSQLEEAEATPTAKSGVDLTRREAMWIAPVVLSIPVSWTVDGWSAPSGSGGAAGGFPQPPTLSPIMPPNPPTLSPIAFPNPPTLSPLPPPNPPTLSPIAPPNPPTLSPLPPPNPPTLSPIAPPNPPTLSPIAPPNPPTLSPLPPPNPPTLSPIAPPNPPTLSPIMPPNPPTLSPIMPPNPPTLSPLPPPAEVFDDGFESGNTSAWSSTQNRKRKPPKRGRELVDSGFPDPSDSDD